MLTKYLLWFSTAPTNTDFYGMRSIMWSSLYDLIELFSIITKKKGAVLTEAHIHLKSVLIITTLSRISRKYFRKSRISSFLRRD